LAIRGDKPNGEVLTQQMKIMDSNITMLMLKKPAVVCWKKIKSASEARLSFL
jgi:hypothetical protein